MGIWKGSVFLLSGLLLSGSLMADGADTEEALDCGCDVKGQSWDFFMEESTGAVEASSVDVQEMLNDVQGEGAKDQAPATQD